MFCMAVQLEIHISFRNTSRNSGQELLDNLTALPGIEKATGEFTGIAFKMWDPFQIPWIEMLVTIKPYAEGAVAFVATKVADKALGGVIDGVVDKVKNHLTANTTMKEKRRARILGPDGKVLRVIEIEDAEVRERDS